MLGKRKEKTKQKEKHNRGTIVEYLCLGTHQGMKHNNLFLALPVTLEHSTACCGSAALAPSAAIWFVRKLWCDCVIAS